MCKMLRFQKSYTTVQNIALGSIHQNWHMWSHPCEKKIQLFEPIHIINKNLGNPEQYAFMTLVVWQLSWVMILVSSITSILKSLVSNMIYCLNSCKFYMFSKL